MREANEKSKHPIIKEEHDCVQMPLTMQISMILLCLFNYGDTVTDIVTTYGMFKDNKYLLGALSVLVMLVAGLFSEMQTRPLEDEKDGSSVKHKWSFKKFFPSLLFCRRQKSKRNGLKWTDLVVGWG